MKVQLLEEAATRCVKIQRCAGWCSEKNTMRICDFFIVCVMLVHSPDKVNLKFHFSTKFLEVFSGMFSQ
jgi:hypothetical protein